MMDGQLFDSNDDAAGNSGPVLPLSVYYFFPSSVSPLPLQVMEKCLIKHNLLVWALKLNLLDNMVKSFKGTF